MEMLVAAALVAAALFVAYANGANDNFKGVATLYGSGLLGYRGALAWATVTTAAGSLCSVFLAEKLVKAFSGKGLVPDAVAADPGFLTAVAIGAAVTVYSVSSRSRGSWRSVACCTRAGSPRPWDGGSPR